MKLYIICTTFCITSAAGIVFAEVPKSKASEFVKEMEAVVKSGDNALRGGSNQGLHDHSIKIKKMRSKAELLFKQSDACCFAAGSAANLWQQKLLQFQRPSTQGDQFIKRAKSDYQDNLDLCKKSLSKFK